MPDSAFTPASLWRRLAAMVYDSLLIFTVLIVVGMTTLPVIHGLGVDRNHIAFKIYLCSAIFVFFGWFWTHGGQTLGMRAWKIRIMQADGSPVSWPYALLHYLLSLPMWGWLIYVIAMNSGMVHTPALLAHTPHWALYLIAAIWFVIDHLPHNWRERVGKVKVVMVS